jgi:hypothetical protein
VHTFIWPDTQMSSVVNASTRQVIIDDRSVAIVSPEAMDEVPKPKSFVRCIL